MSFTVYNPVQKMFLQHRGGMGVYRWKVTKLYWIQDDCQGNITIKMHLEKEEISCITSLPSLGHFPGPQLENFRPRSDLRDKSNFPVLK